MKQYILSIDQGTTGTTVSLINTAAALIAQHDQDFPQHYPKPGWVEHDLRQIWQTIETCVREVLKKSNVKASEIAAIGITNQRETVSVWNRETGEPFAPAIVWQCRRTTDVCDKLKKQKRIVQLVRKKTGLVIDPYFSGSKIQWLLNNVEGLKKQPKKGLVCAGTIDTYVLFRLTSGGSFATDVSNASRTMLMNIHTGKWDKDLLKLFSVPQEILPNILPSSGVFGHTKGLSVLPDGIPIAGIAGDQQSALFGQACFEVGTAKCTYGTGSFILMNTGSKPVASRSGMLTTIAWQLGKGKIQYALEGGAFICGAAVQWLRDELRFFSSSTEVEGLAASVSNTGGVEFVPALAGLGAPYWDPSARGMILGLTRGSNRAHVARATLEAMALQNVDILRAMEKDAKKKLKELKVDGGASSNSLLMQIQADYLGTVIVRPKNIETTSMGAAFLAGLGVGMWTSLDEIKKVWASDRAFTAAISKRDQSKRVARWHHAIETCRRANEL